MALKIELLTVGSELLSGATVNTNAAYLAGRLQAVGLSCCRQVAVPDDLKPLGLALQEAIQRSDVVLLTGGLGPTLDDQTIAVIAHVTGRRLRYLPGVARQIHRFYARCHRRVQAAALRQAYLPAGAVALANPIGTAPGMWLALPHPIIIAMPGVPREMRLMLEGSVLPRLRRLPGASRVAVSMMRTAGIVELEIQHILQRLRLPAELEIGLYPHLRMVDVQLRMRAGSQQQAQRLLQPYALRVRRTLGDWVYANNGTSLSEAVGALLLRRHATIAVAESCTGGLVSHELTEVPGSSRYLRGSIVAYHNDLKEGPLAVPREVLRRYGAVSRQTAELMAQGIRRWANASAGLSITGIAGPGGGTAVKPVGLVYVGLADERDSQTVQLQLTGDRTSIKAQASQAALDFLRRSLLQR